MTPLTTTTLQQVASASRIFDWVTYELSHNQSIADKSPGGPKLTDIECLPTPNLARDPPRGTTARRPSTCVFRPTGFVRRRRAKRTTTRGSTRRLSLLLRESRELVSGRNLRRPAGGRKLDNSTGTAKSGLIKTILRPEDMSYEQIQEQVPQNIWGLKIGGLKIISK